MRKKIILILLLLLLTMVGCSSKGDVKVYEDTEENSVSHTEVSMTAVILNINLEDNIIGFRDCQLGEDYKLIYHGGVRISNKYDRELNINELRAGSVVDVVYYEDTEKLCSITEAVNANKIENIKKFSSNLDAKKATYKGTSCALWEKVVAINHDGEQISISEVSTEDEVTLYMLGTKLVSVVVDKGHGYVKLSNQESYIGGMVEIGYDVIVPVTENMLIPVREGEYTLRVSKNGYSATKKVSVIKDSETMVSLLDIAVPEGTAIFETTPADAIVYVSGKQISGHTYTANYGTYGLKIEAEGYKTYQGSFKIKDTINNYKFALVEKENEPDDTTETTTITEETTDTATSESSTEEGDSTTTEAAGTTEAGEDTGNVITVKAPELASVYVDGDYVGVTPVTFKKVTGAHTITLYRSGYLIKSYTVYAVNDGKDDEYSYPELTSLLDLID